MGIEDEKIHVIGSLAIDNIIESRKKRKYLDKNHLKKKYFEKNILVTTPQHLKMLDITIK